VSHEFQALAIGKTTPVVDWLRAFIREEMRNAKLIGVVGMCMSGGYALALATDTRVVAPVVSQPALPFPHLLWWWTRARARRDVGLGSTDLQQIVDLAHDTTDPLLVRGYRFTCDRLSPAERFQTLRDRLGASFLGSEIDSAPGNAWQIRGNAHSVLTVDRNPDPNHPTSKAVRECSTSSSNGSSTPEEWLCETDWIENGSAGALRGAGVRAVLSRIGRALSSVPTQFDRVMVLECVGAAGRSDTLGAIVARANEVAEPGDAAALLLTARSRSAGQRRCHRLRRTPCRQAWAPRGVDFARPPPACNLSVYHLSVQTLSGPRLCTRLIPMLSRARPFGAQQAVQSGIGVDRRTRPSFQSLVLRLRPIDDLHVFGEMVVEPLDHRLG
jgi:hypothetical protein